MTAPAFAHLDLEVVRRELRRGAAAAGAPQHDAREIADVAVHAINQAVSSFNRAVAPAAAHIRHTASIAAMQVMQDMLTANIEQAIAQFVEQGGTPYEHVADLTAGSIQ